MHLTIADIQTAHRLQGDDKVIVKFVKRRIRDSIYEGRFDLNRRGARVGGAGPLYINESLTSFNRAIYNELLEARKPANGAKIASVFSRRGVVYCRRVRGGENILVADQARLRNVLGGARCPPPRRDRRPAPPSGPGRSAAPPTSGAAGPGRDSSAGAGGGVPPPPPLPPAGLGSGSPAASGGPLGPPSAASRLPGSAVSARPSAGPPAPLGSSAPAWRAAAGAVSSSPA